jgi:hypothetical protein
MPTNFVVGVLATQEVYKYITAILYYEYCTGNFISGYYIWIVENIGGTKIQKVLNRMCRA